MPIGRHANGALDLDLDRLLAGRLLIQGSSGAGKSRTLRRIVEEAFDYVTVVLVDPEGEFENLARHIGATTLRTVEGLWRSSTARRPGRMTDLIRAERLLSSSEVDRIVRSAPTDLVRFQDVAATVPIEDRAPIASWIERFNVATHAPS